MSTKIPKTLCGSSIPCVITIVSTIFLFFSLREFQEEIARLKQSLEAKMSGGVVSGPKGERRKKKGKRAESGRKV